MPGYEPKTFTDEERQQFATSSETHLRYRKQIESLGSRIYPLFLTDSPVQEQMGGLFRQNMLAALEDKGLHDKLIPDWKVGCRRMTPVRSQQHDLSSNALDTDDRTPRELAILRASSMTNRVSLWKRSRR